MSKQRTAPISPDIKQHVRIVTRTSDGRFRLSTTSPTVSLASFVLNASHFLSRGDGVSQHPTPRTLGDALTSRMNINNTKRSCKGWLAKESNDVSNQSARSLCLENRQIRATSGEKRPVDLSGCRPNFGARRLNEAEMVVREECS